MQKPTTEPIAESAAEQSQSAAEKQPHPFYPNRWADGTQRPAAFGIATKNGARARLLTQELAAIVGDLDSFHAWLKADQGDRADVAVPAGYMQRLTEAEGIVRQLGHDLRTRGIFTPRGRMRSTFPAYLQAVATWDRLAQRLGMERRTKDANVLDGSINDYIAAQSQRQPTAHAAPGLGGLDHDSARDDSQQKETRSPTETAAATDEQLDQ